MPLADHSDPMSPIEPFRNPPDPGDQTGPWWSTLAVALVLTLAAVGAGLLAGGIA